jgi:DNA excision repair protein ERCC-6
LHGVLEEIENGVILDAARAIDVVIHPPDDEDSDEESGDEDVPETQHLPKKVLNATVDVEVEMSTDDEEGETPMKKRKVMKWSEGWINETPPSAKAVKVRINCEYLNNFSYFPFWFLLQTTNEVQPNVEAIEFFRLFFDDEVFKFIQKETAAYSGEVVHMAELEAVFGVLLASGVNQVPRRRDYWSNNSTLRNPAIADAIGVRRFEEIFPKLHFMPLKVKPGEDKFVKVRALLDLLNKRFMSKGTSSCSFSVDESMVPYFGRHGCKQFIKGKPVRFGFKMWVCASPTGYVFHLQPYPGIAEKGIPGKDLGASSNVVYYFANLLHQEYPGEVATFTCDNYFTSLHLLAALKQDFNYSATGTIRKNRVPSCPSRVAAELEKKPRGEYLSWVNDDSSVNFVSWRDNRVVCLASSACGVHPVKQVKRFSRTDKRHINIQCPEVVRHYNANMGGVDMADANIARCRTSIRGKKWYYPIVLYLLDVAVSNAWLLYRQSSRKHLTLATFRAEVAANLLASSHSGRKLPNQVSSLTRYDGQDHLIVHCEKQLRCAVCNNNASFMCEKCLRYLHPKGCFKIFHNK